MLGMVNNEVKHMRSVWSFGELTYLFVIGERERYGLSETWKKDALYLLKQCVLFGC